MSHSCFGYHFMRPAYSGEYFQIELEISIGTFFDSSELKPGVRRSQVARGTTKGPSNWST
jgi:hypothetical protein